MISYKRELFALIAFHFLFILKGKGVFVRNAGMRSGLVMLYCEVLKNFKFCFLMKRLLLKLFMTGVMCWGQKEELEPFWKIILKLLVAVDGLTTNRNSDHCKFKRSFTNGVLHLF